MSVQLANLNTFEDVLKGITQLKSMNVGDKVLQETIEGIYSKKNIRKLIENDLKDSPNILAAIYTSTKFIEDWMQEDFYKSKNLEIRKLEGVDLEEMVMNIMIILMQQDFHFFEMTKVIANVMRCTPFGDVIEELEDDTPNKAYMRGIACSCSILVLMAEADLIDIIPANRSVKGTVCVSLPFSFDGETGKAIQRAKFLPPMLCKPKTLKSNKESAYLTFNSHRITKKLQQHDGDVCLDVINLVNSIPYTLNQKMLEVTEDEFEFKDDKPHDEEKQKELFDAHTKATKQTAIELISLGNKFYFEWFVDYRGRMYDRGYEIHIQGNCYKKAMLDFYEPRKIEGFEAYASIFDFDVPSETELALEELEQEESNQSNNDDVYGMKVETRTLKITNQDGSVDTYGSDQPTVDEEEEGEVPTF